MLDQHQTGIVGGVHQHRGEGIPGPHLIAGAEAGALAHRMGRLVAHRQQLIGLPVRIEQHQRGEQLGQRGRCARRIEVASPQQLPIEHRGIRGSGVGIRVAVMVRNRPDAACICEQQQRQQRAM